MVQPPGFIDANNPSYVCRLQKALYGVKQAPRAWYWELHSCLISNGFVNSKCDASLFTYSADGICAYLLIYVDDIIFTENNSSFMGQFIKTLSRHFSIKDLGTLNYFLGVEVFPIPNGLFLSQHKYIRDLLKRNNISGTKEVGTPLS